MSGPGFLSRWAHRKAAAQRSADPLTVLDAQAAVDAEADLPPLETLDAASDYTGFLAAGVSRATQTRALSIAWASDPAIAGFRGMAEYDWDFNAVGYGRLAAGDNVAALLQQIILPIQDRPPADAGVEPPAPAVAEAPLPVSVRVPDARLAVAQIEPVPEPVVEPQPGAKPSARRHGGALPS